MTRLIIKGAIYENGEMLLRPHFTGEFYIVDCTEYKTKKQIKEEYSEAISKRFLAEQPFEYNGVKYFECEFGPRNTSNFTLLSDLSEIEFFDETTSF